MLPENPRALCVPVVSTVGLPVLPSGKGGEGFAGILRQTRLIFAWMIERST